MLVPNEQLLDQWWVYKPSLGWVRANLTVASLIVSLLEAYPDKYEGWKVLCGAAPVENLAGEEEETKVDPPRDAEASG